MPLKRPCGRLAEGGVALAMIVAITTRGHDDTMASLSDGRFGFPIPKFVMECYDRLLVAKRVPRATYIFTDLERLAPWELGGAGELFRALTEQGLRCLNDPARAKSRVELLRALHAAGINPFDVWRAEEDPKPTRFPVLLRNEDDHWRPLPDLIESQEELDRSLKYLRDKGVPLRGILVIALRRSRPALAARTRLITRAGKGPCEPLQRRARRYSAEGLRI